MLKMGLALSAVIICSPVFLTVLGSLKSGNELAASLAPVLNGTSGMIEWKLFPLYPTLIHFVKLLIWTPDFFTVFWNSMKIVGDHTRGTAGICGPGGVGIRSISI